jgi:hypothetical protein
MHALSLEPIVHMSKADVSAEPEGTTECPYVEVGSTVQRSLSAPQMKHSNFDDSLGEIFFFTISSMSFLLEALPPNFDMTTHKSSFNVCQHLYLKFIQEQSLCLKITVLRVNSIKSKTLSGPLGELSSSEIKVPS